MQFKFFVYFFFFPTKRRDVRKVKWEIGTYREIVAKGEQVENKYDSRSSCGLVYRKIRDRLNRFVKDSIWTWRNTVQRNFLVRAALPVQQKVYKTWIPGGDSQGLAES